MEKAYQYLSAFFVSQAQAANNSLVSCGGLDCNVCSILETIGNTLNWLLFISAVAGIAIIVLGGFMYIGANGKEANMQKAKRWILNTVIGLVIVFVAWLVIHSLFHVFGATYKDSWWKIECEVEPPTISSRLSIRTPSALLEASKDGGNLSAVLARGTDKQELADFLKNLPDGKTVSFKIDRGQNAETVIILKKENGKIKLVASNEKIKDEKGDKGSWINANFKFALASTDSLSGLESITGGTSDIDFYTSFLALIEQLIAENEKIIAIITETQTRLQNVNLCIGSGGSWYRFSNNCELENESCRIEGQVTKSCATAEGEPIDGCKCPTDTCLINNECVPTSDENPTAQSRCKETGGVWGNFPVFQINAGRCSIYDPIFPYFYYPEGVSYADDVVSADETSNLSTLASGGSDYFIDYATKEGCVCSLDKCLGEDNGCYPWDSPDPIPPTPVPGPDLTYAKKVCTESGGEWTGSGIYQFKSNCKNRGGTLSHSATDTGIEKECCGYSDGTVECFVEEIPAETDSAAKNLGASENAYISITYPNFDGYCKCPTGGTTEVYNYKDGHYYVSCSKSDTGSVQAYAKKLCTESGGSWSARKNCVGTKCLDDPGYCKCPVGKLEYTHGYFYLGANRNITKCHDKNTLGNNCTGSGGQWRNLSGLGIPPIPSGENAKRCGGPTVEGGLTDVIYNEVLEYNQCPAGWECDYSSSAYYCNCPKGTCVSDEDATCQGTSDITKQQKCSQSGGTWKTGKFCCQKQNEQCGNEMVLCDCPPPENTSISSYCDCPTDKCLSGDTCVDKSPTGEELQCKQSGGAWQHVYNYNYCDGTGVGINCNAPPYSPDGVSYGCPMGCKCPSGTCLDKNTKMCTSAPSTDQQKCVGSGGSWENTGNPINHCDGTFEAYHDRWWLGCRCPDGKCLDKTTKQCRSDNSNDNSAGICTNVGPPCGIVCPEWKNLEGSPFSKTDTDAIVAAIRAIDNADLPVKSIEKVSETEAEVWTGACAGSQYEVTKSNGVWKAQLKGGWIS